MTKRHYQKAAAAFTTVLLMLAFSPVHSQEGAFYLRTEAGTTYTSVRIIDTRLNFGYTLLPTIEIEGGVAWSLGLEADFISVHAGPRFVFGRYGHYFVSSIKITLGFNQPLLPKHTGDNSYNFMSGTPVFLDLALAGYEYRFPFGLTLTASVGLTLALGGGSFWDNEGQEVGAQGSAGFLIYGGLGYRF